MHIAGSCASHTINKGASKSNSSPRSSISSSMTYTQITHPNSNRKPPPLQVSSTCTLPA